MIRGTDGVLVTVDLHHPELEALIRERMGTGRFSTVEEALISALKASEPGEEERSRAARSGRTGADLINAMQACPFPEIDLAPARFPMPMREVRL